MNSYWYGIWTIFILVLSFGLSAQYENKGRGRPVVHWFLGLMAGVGALASFILGIWM